MIKIYEIRLVFKELPVDPGRIRPVKNGFIIDRIGISNKCIEYK